MQTQQPEPDRNITGWKERKKQKRTHNYVNKMQHKMMEKQVSVSESCEIIPKDSTHICDFQKKRAVDIWTRND